MNNYKFCPRCKNEITFIEDHYSCDNCGLKIYIDPKPCVSALPVKDGKVLLSVRAIEPYKGEYDLIGGFIKNGKTVAEAIKREVLEETGLDIKIIELLGTYPDRYGEGGDYTINIQFVVEIIGGEPAPKDDVASLKWVSIDKLPKLNGFNNTRETLKELQKWYRKTGRDLQKS